MNIRKIKPKLLTSENFKIYGEVIAPIGDFRIANQGNSKKWNNLVELDMFQNGGKVNLGILRTKNIEFSFNQMERHFFTSQIFIPLGGKRSLVAVAPSNKKRPDPNKVEVFSMKGNQGISFYCKTWHHTLFPLEGETEYVLIMRGGSFPPDVELVPFDNNIEFVIEI